MLLLRLQLRYCAEQLKAERQEGGAPPIGEEAEVPDADEAFGSTLQHAKESGRNKIPSMDRKVQ